jgi:transcriptional regulator with GAF, ATPase, and Fis domain
VGPRLIVRREQERFTVGGNETEGMEKIPVSYHPTALGLTVLGDPALATEQILVALRKEGANIRAAASRLGVTERTLHRHILKLGIKKRVESLRAKAIKEGWLKSARWPDA